MFKLYCLRNNREEIILDITKDDDPTERGKSYYRKHGLEVKNLTGIAVYDLRTEDQSIAQAILNTVKHKLNFPKKRSYRPRKGKPLLLFKEPWYHAMETELHRVMQELGFSPSGRMPKSTYLGFSAYYNR